MTDPTTETGEISFSSQSSPSPLSLTIPSPAISQSSGNHFNSGSGFKRGRLLIRQQRIKKDGEVTGDLETPDVYSSSDYLLSVPSSSIATTAKIERHASEPSPITSNLMSSPSVSSQNLLTVPTQSTSSYLVKQYSHPLLPSQTTSTASYTLTRQLSYPTQTNAQSQIIANTSFSSHAAQEMVAGQLLQLQHQKPPVRSHTMPHYTINEIDNVNERPQVSGSPTVLIIPEIPSEQQQTISSEHQSHIQSSSMAQQPIHQKQVQQQQLPSIRVKSEELQRSISSPLVSFFKKF